MVLSSVISVICILLLHILMCKLLILPSFHVVPQFGLLFHRNKYLCAVINLFVKSFAKI